MNLRQAAQQALEALEAVNNESLWWGKKDAAITALRAALAEPEPKPVAWIYSQGTAKVASLNHVPGVRATPLYTAPPQRKPLTDGEIEQLLGAIADTPRAQWLRQAAIEVVRKTEAAHGIKEQEHE